MQRIGSADGKPSDIEFSAALYEWPATAINGEQVWVRCNMVMTQDGAAVGSDGRSGGINSEVDKRVFSALRKDSDVILVGAGTARAEGYRPATVPIALVSKHLAFTQELPLFAQKQPDSPTTLVLTTAQAIEVAPDWLKSSAELIECGFDEVDLATALEVLKSRGLTRVHSEGGPALLTSLIQAQLLDELLLTITPQIQGATKSLIGSLETPIGGTIAQVLVEDGTILLKFLPQYPLL